MNIAVVDVYVFLRLNFSCRTDNISVARFYRPLKTFFSKAEYPMAINLYYDSNKRALIDTTTPIKGGNGSACKSRTAKMTSTLFSTGILRKARQKSNEYFGGDSTVVSGGDDSDVLGDE